MRVRAGLHVESVTEGSIAEKAGLINGDVLIKYNDRMIRSHSDLVVATRDNTDKDKPVTLTIFRAGQETTLNAEVGKLGVSLKEGTYLSPEGEEKAGETGTFLIGVLNFTAWVALILGIIASVVVFSSFAFISLPSRFGTTTHFNLIGALSASAIFVQSFIVFALLKVIATMALEVKSIKSKVFS